MRLLNSQTKYNENILKYVMKLYMSIVGTNDFSY